MNDSLRTDLFVRYSPEAVACGCIYLATRTEKRPVPTRQAWYQVLFEVSEEDVRNIATSILLLYSIKMPPVKEVEDAITALRTSIDNQRQKGPLADIKAAAADATPDSIRTDSPDEPRKPVRERSRSREPQPVKRSRDRTLPRRQSRTRSPVYRRSPDRRKRSRSSEERDERRRRERSREDRRRENRERDRRRRH
ncbi:hypothetical protein RvY_13418 [Ramazzottius varieornatus]|uniref:Cyclin-like domain-containing protein n=1 Tax=Ramazzottius varieornatus TaxID=947166 RepID=A0A1D1VPZ3_RAMVA|nr:hypothetical protein RvY_13418 [Ramazzottius varieornatus]